MSDPKTTAQALPADERERLLWLMAQARGLIAHWDEFGREHGFDEHVEFMRRHLARLAASPTAVVPAAAPATSMQTKDFPSVRKARRAAHNALGYYRSMLGATPPAAAAPAPWRCFHCDETFTDAARAREHFGSSEYQQPACQIDITEYRRMEEANRRHCEEDTELHRALHRKDSDHQQALLREEEKGYARGLRDATRFPADAAVAAAPVVPADFTAEQQGLFRKFVADLSARFGAPPVVPAEPAVSAAPAHELAAALGWPGGISAEPADWNSLLREVANLRVAAPVADIGMVCKTAPERIWLQVDPEPEEDGQPVYQSDDVTWCSDKINESDTLYIRADLATKAVPAGEALMTDERERCAKLCDELAYMMESGAGELEPGARLRQAARNIRQGAEPIGIDAALGAPAAAKALTLSHDGAQCKDFLAEPAAPAPVPAPAHDCPCGIPPESANICSAGTCATCRAARAAAAQETWASSENIKEIEKRLPPLPIEPWSSDSRYPAECAAPAPTLSVKRSEWRTLSPEAQAKLEQITGAEHPDTKRAKAQAAEDARGIVLGGKASPQVPPAWLPLPPDVLAGPAKDFVVHDRGPCRTVGVVRQQQGDTNPKEKP